MNHSLANLVLADHPGETTKGQVSCIISELAEVNTGSRAPGLDKLQYIKGGNSISFSENGSSLATEMGDKWPQIRH